MQFSSDGPGGPWQPSPAITYDAVYSGWPVSPGNGLKQVWGRFADCNGNAVVLTDTITLDQVSPPAPGLQATAGNNRVELQWSAAVDPGGSASGVALYRVYRLDKGASSPITVTRATSYTDREVADQAYTYWVTAVDAAGNESRPESAHVTATPR
jgi:hypothetical protein